MKKNLSDLKSSSPFDATVAASRAESQAPLSNGDDTVIGTDGDDRLWAGGGNDLIDGLAGNDTIEGAGGFDDDTYLFGKGDGHDTITRGTTFEAEYNTLQFKPGVTPSDVVFTRVWRTYADDGGNLQSEYVDLRIMLASTGDSVSIEDFSRGDNPFANGNPLSAIRFDDGTTWDLAAICAKIGQGTSGADLLVGFGFAAETLQGFAGNDTMIGNGGDTLLGGEGDDELSGEAVRLDGGSGNDNLQGLEGAALLGGGGNDTLYGGSNLQGGAGDDFLSADVATLVGGSGSDRLMGTERSVLLGGEGDDDLSAAEGGTSTVRASLRGGSGNDKLQGGLYTEVWFDRGDGHDAYSGFSNADGEATSADRATLNLGSGIVIGDVHLTLAGNTLQLGFGTDGVDLVDYFADAGSVKRGPDAVISVGTVAFSSGESQDVRNWLINGTNSANTLVGSAGDDLIAGYVGNDKLDGGQGHDGLHGGVGDDSLTGGDGNDTLVGYVGKDTLVGGLGDDVYYLDDYDALINEVAGAGVDTVVYGPAKYVPVTEYTLRDNFENLTLLEGSAALIGNGNGLANLLTGNQLDNSLNGNAGVDTLVGGDGNDKLDGGLGGDNMQGGAGDDMFFADDALDLTAELLGNGVDTVVTGLNWVLAANIENLQLTGAAATKGTGNSLANALTGSDGANTLLGLDGNDILDGGMGSDRLEGGKGGDTYLFAKGDGKDIVVEKDATVGVRDVANLGELTHGEVKFVHVGDNLEARIIGTHDKLVFKDWYLGSRYQVEDFKFADGTWTGDQVAPALSDWPLYRHGTHGLIDTGLHDVFM